MTTIHRRATTLLTGVILAADAVLTGCGGGKSTTTLDVAVTSSLTDALPVLSRRYEEGHPLVRLRLTFGGSTELATGLSGRSAPDVFIAADTTTLDGAAKRLTGHRVVVAHNSMTIAVGPGNPKRIRGLADLAAPGLRLALGAPSVPVGRYSRQVLTKAGLQVPPALAEADSRSVLSRVRTGQADAGIVYITDLRSAGAAATWVPIPAVQNITTTYQAAIVKKTEHEDAGRAFLTWLTASTAKAVLKAHGFAAP